MKKYLFSTLLAAALLLAGCSKEAGTRDGVGSEEDPHTFAGYPVVYMARNISPEGISSLLEELGAPLSGKVAVKLSKHISEIDSVTPKLIDTILDSADDAVPVSGSTAYGTSILPDTDILDEESSIALTVDGGDILSETYIGNKFLEYDYLIVLSHFQLDPKIGFTGVLKDVSMGLASAEGKNWIASGGTSLTDPQCDEATARLYAIGEASKAVADSLNGSVLYIGIVDDRSLQEIGGADGAIRYTVASYDPVALDMACIDLITHSESGDVARQYIDNQNGLYTLAHAERIGLGSCTYALLDIS